MGMVDISYKEETIREAWAEGKIILSESTIKLLPKAEKGDVFECAKVAGILAVKNTPSIVPHCHQIPIEAVNFDFFVEKDGVRVVCYVKATAKTGVEMEALVGVTSSLLTIWDMIKKYEKDSEGNYPNVRIESIRVIRKVKKDAHRI